MHLKECFPKAIFYYPFFYNVMEYKDRVYSAETIIKGELILYLIKKLFENIRYIELKI
jgi:hypothetical protein